jgi:3-oxoacyl-[acyl-carrier protein] reductase
VDAITAKGGKAIYVHCDVTKREDWDAALAATEQAFGGINFVINNAGWTYQSKPVLQTTDKDFDLCIDVNLKSIFHSVHVMLPAFRRTREKGGPAVMVNVASTGACNCVRRMEQCAELPTAGIMGRPGLSWYCASKAAVISVTKNLSIEFGAEQIVSVSSGKYLSHLGPLHTVALDASAVLLCDHNGTTAYT